MSTLEESEPFVEIAVGKRSFYVPLARIQKFPESYFCVALKPHWNNNECLKSDGNVEAYKLQVDRDSRLFRYIAMYLDLGCVPRDEKGNCVIDPILFAALREEADYFCLSSMVAELDILLIPYVFSRYIGSKMDSECSRDGGIILGSRTDTWFSTSQPLGFLQNMIKNSPDGFCSACSLNIDSFDDITVDSTVVRCVEHHLNYQTLLNVYARCGGRAKLSVADYVYSVIKAACSNRLNIPQTSHKVKFQQVTVRTSSSEFTINNTEDISDDTIVAYALVSQWQPGLDVVSGGEIELDFDSVHELIPYRNICAMESVKYKLYPVLQGVQYVLKYVIVKESCGIEGRGPSNSRPLGPKHSIQESRQQSLDHLLHCIQQYGAIGVYSSCCYLTASKFRPETLLEGSYDKELYEFATSRGIHLSMVYVRCSKKAGKVQYLPQPHDMLLNCHKQNKNICFLTSNNDCSVYCTFDKRTCHRHESNSFITSAFIVG